MGALAALVFCATLGDPGVLNGLERALLDRFDGAAGVPLDQLRTSPWLPDRLVFACLAVIDAPLGLRLSDAAAAAATVAVTAWMGVRIWGRPLHGVLAGLVVCACPSFIYGARVGGGDALGNLATVLFIAICLGRTDQVRASDPHRRFGGMAAVGAALAGIALLGVAVASRGLLLGGALTCLVACTVVGDRRWRRALAALGIAALGGSLWLILQQGDGFIPLLGAAKNLRLADQPFRRPLSATLAAHAHGVFPWFPLAMVGAVTTSGRTRWIAAWWLTGLIAYTGWTSVYGAVEAPLEVPLALCVVHGIDHLARLPRASATRAMWVAAAIVGMAVMGADFKSSPGTTLIPAYDRPRWFEVDAVSAQVESLGRWLNRGAMLGVGLTALVHRMSRDAKRPSWGRAGPIVFALWCGLACVQAVLWTHTVAEDARNQRTLEPAMNVHAALVRDGVIQAPLGALRVNERALRASTRAPTAPAIKRLETRKEARAWLHAADEPRAALVNAEEVPALYAVEDRSTKPIYVVERTHPKVWLVTNVLPPTMSDLSPIPEVLKAAAAGTGTPTDLQFGDALELLEWEVVGTPRVGDTFHLRLTFRAKKKLPLGSRITARLKRGRISRVHERPERLAHGVYPTNLWRYGDILVHDAVIRVPPLEALPGAHDVIVTIHEREKSPLSIRHARAKTAGETTGDVATSTPRIIGKKQEKAILGTIEVLPAL